MSVALTAAALAIGVPTSTGPLQALGLVEADAPAATAPSRGGVEASESHASIVKFRRQVFGVREKPVKPAEVVEAPAEEEVEVVEEVAPAAPAGSVEEIISASALEFGLDPGYLIGVASCESGLDPGAYNSAGYHGLFQFDEQTWAAYGYGDIFDPSAQSRTAARLIASGQGGRWPNCA